MRFAKWLAWIVPVYCALLTALAAQDTEKPPLYSTDTWEIAGAPGMITWVEIQNSEEAKSTGIAHLWILARKRGAPAWELEYVCHHLAITTDALQRSVIRPYKTRKAYPERYAESYHLWLEEKKKGAAMICDTSIADYLKQHPQGSPRAD